MLSLQLTLPPVLKLQRFAFIRRLTPFWSFSLHPSFLSSLLAGDSPIA